MEVKHVASFAQHDMWPDRRLLDLLTIEHPILLAPMADAMDVELAAAVADAGGLAALPCATLTPQEVRAQLRRLRARTSARVNLAFSCHMPPKQSKIRERR